jgi:hypothetical protein
MIAAILTRYRLPIAGALAVVGLLLALMYYRSGWQAEKALRERDRASYALAQAEAEAKALADVRARETAQRAMTTRIEDERNDLQERFADLGARYRERMRGKAAACVASVVPGPGESPSAGLSAPATEVAELVGITGDDFNRCTVNAGDLVKARDWAFSLP